MNSPSTSAARPVLVLGSGSVYRKELLARLQWPFLVRSPDVDETPLPHETPLATSVRLAKLKAEAVSRMADVVPQDAIIIGSDQVAELHGQALGKPGNHERAVAQLLAMQGQQVNFHTSVTVLRPATGHAAHITSTSVVQVRPLSLATIEHYLALEQPYDCAGSAKAEGLGICLLDRIDSDDPTSLIGLPLIATARMLREAGLDPLA